MEKQVNIIINGKSAVVPADYTILQAAEQMGIFIPRLCFLKGINENSSCRLCVVEIKGIRTLKNSCTVKVSEGMEVLTNTDRVRTSVIQTLKLIAANHRQAILKKFMLLILLSALNVEAVVKHVLRMQS